MSSDTNLASTGSMAKTPSAIQHICWFAYDDIGAAVAETVADVTSRAVTDLEPLQHTIDVDALQRLCSTSASDHLELTFAYEGVDVRVTNDGVLEVTT